MSDGRVMHPLDAVKSCSFPVPFTLDDDDVIAGVMVIIKVVDGQGRSGVALSHDDVDWITRIGMLDFCLTAERANGQGRGED